MYTSAGCRVPSVTTTSGQRHQEPLAIGGDIEVVQRTHGDVGKFDRIGCGKRLHLHFRNEDAWAFVGPVAYAARTERFEDLVVTEGFADQNDGSLPGGIAVTLV